MVAGELRRRRVCALGATVLHLYVARLVWVIKSWSTVRGWVAVSNHGTDSAFGSQKRTRSNSRPAPLKLRHSASSTNKNNFSGSDHLGACPSIVHLVQAEEASSSARFLAASLGALFVPRLLHAKHHPRIYPNVETV